MFQDIGVSKDLNEQFKKHLTNSEPLDRECGMAVGCVHRVVHGRWKMGILSWLKLECAGQDPSPVTQEPACAC